LHIVVDSGYSALLPSSARNFLLASDYKQRTTSASAATVPHVFAGLGAFVLASTGEYYTGVVDKPIVCIISVHVVYTLEK